ncbi:MAG: hypothetical protein F9K25_19135 [Candidatus Contendobacter sp.]|nr:MAG: hypothetical protein F9K25_19135 [Candidatus Contendobacter sp.]
MNTPEIEPFNVETEFRAALVTAGLETAAPIIADSTFRRFKVNGDRAPNSWYVLHSDGVPAGAFGCWKRGIDQTWCSRQASELTPEQRHEHERRMQAAKEQRDAEQANRANAAVGTANKIWAASPPAPADHPYLVKKGVSIPGLRATGDSLLVPLCDLSGTVRSLQYIAADGGKLFLKNAPKRGLFFTLGDLTSTDQAYITEGVATAASVYMATGLPVVAAMDAGNLTPVAMALRQAYPALALIFAADHDDPNTPQGNVGTAKATHAARSVHGMVVYPAATGTDFNDLHQAEGLDAVRERLATAIQPETAVEPTARPERLRIQPGERAEMTDAAELALLKHRANVYQRGGQLVRVRMAHAETVMGVTRKGGTPVITPVDADYLVDQMDRIISFEKYNERRHDYVVADAPRQVATSLLSRAGEWKANRLVSLITVPTLRPDGSLIERPGYDVKTGLLFVETGVRFPDIPAAPSPAAGRAALDFLFKSVLSEFPFTAAHHRSVALSAILTALVRQSLETAPLHAFTAPRAGSGKSLIADVVALIATGSPATVMTYAGEEDEQRKRIFSVLLAGDTVVNIDNIEEPLQGSALCSVLTGQQYTDRVLGSSRMETTNTICTWLATGNNLVFKGDITRRVLLCELDPCCERPEDRTFTRDLYDWIPANRPKLVAAGLTAIRAYVMAGKPKPVPTLGSFGAWSNLVRSALVWLGEADPLLSRDEIESVDPLRAKLRALMLAWYHTFKTMPTTCHEAIYKAQAVYRNENGIEVFEAPELREVLLQHLTNRRGELCSRILGEFISDTAKRIECGGRMEASGTSQRAVRWRVVPIDRPTLDKALQDFHQG